MFTTNTLSQSIQFLLQLPDYTGWYVTCDIFHETRVLFPRFFGCSTSVVAVQYFLKDLHRTHFSGFFYGIYFRSNVDVGAWCIPMWTCPYVFLHILIWRDSEHKKSSRSGVQFPTSFVHYDWSSLSSILILTAKRMEITSSDNLHYPWVVTVNVMSCLFPLKIWKMSINKFTAVHSYTIRSFYTHLTV